MIEVEIDMMTSGLQTYFDAAASTPLDPEVQSTLIEHLSLGGNNNSKHVAGFEAQKVINEGLKTMARVLGCNWEQLSIMYSGTDANRRFINECNRRFLAETPGSPWGAFSWCSAAEHSSVTDEVLGQNQFDPDSLEGLQNEARLVCLMGANSETGKKYRLEALKEKCPKALLLQDCSQSFAKGVLPDFKNADAVVLTPQKFYGPKHVGILYLKNPENFPNISKDSHTKNPSLVAATAKAFEIWERDRDQNIEQLQKFETKIRDYIVENIPNYKFHDQAEERVPGLVNVAFSGVRGGELMTTLSREEGLCVSIGSACTSDIMVPTEYIKYIEPETEWQYPIRISLHKFLTEEAVQDFCEILDHYVENLRSRS